MYRTAAERRWGKLDRPRRHSIAVSYVEVPRAQWRMHSLHYIALENAILTAWARLQRFLDTVRRYKEAVAAVKYFSQYRKFSDLESSFRSDCLDYMLALQIDIDQLADNQFMICKDFDFESKRIADEIGATEKNLTLQHDPLVSNILGGGPEPKLSNDAKADIKQRRYSEEKNPKKEKRKSARRKVRFSISEQSLCTDHTSGDNGSNDTSSGPENSKNSGTGTKKGILTTKTKVSIFRFLRRSDSLDSVRSVGSESSSQEVLQELWRQHATLRGGLSRHEDRLWRMVQLRRALLDSEDVRAGVLRMRECLLSLLQRAEAELVEFRAELGPRDMSVRRLAHATWRCNNAFPPCPATQPGQPRRPLTQRQPVGLARLFRAALRFLFCVPVSH